MKWYNILKAGPWGYLKESENASYLTFEGGKAVLIPHMYERKFGSKANEKSIVSMLNSVWQMVEDKVNYRFQTIDVTAHSGHHYTMYLNRASYCKFQVFTEKESDIGNIPVNLCIEIDENQEKPYGDILAGWILTLVNDEQASEDIDTLYDFLHGGYTGDTQCQFCHVNFSFALEDIPEVFECDHCNVYSCRLGPGMIDQGQTEMLLEHYNEEFLCPECRGEAEVRWSGWGNIAICEDDRLVATPEGYTYRAMEIDGKLEYADVSETQDEDIVEFEGRQYRYTDGMRGELVEEEE